MFVALYALIRPRSGRRAEPFWPDQARWLALILACAGVAVLAGEVV